MRRAVSIGLLAAVAALAGCGDDEVSGPPPSAPAGIVLSSAAFGQGRHDPQAVHVLRPGAVASVALARRPARRASLALLVEDPDARGGTFVHRTAWDIPPTTTALPAAAEPPREGQSSGGDTGWQPPCPPEDDEPHRYTFTLYALRAPLGLDDGAEPEEVRDAIGQRGAGEGSADWPVRALDD